MKGESTVDLIRQASWQAGVLTASGSVRQHDWEDVRQELMLDCLRRSRRFDPARGEWTGFVRGVMRHHATVLVKQERLHRQREVLTEDVVTIGRRDDDDRLRCCEIRDNSRYVELEIDVRTVLECLPAPLRRLAEFLGEMPVKQICSRLNKSRSRVYQMTVQLRVAFQAAGLEPRKKPIQGSDQRLAPHQKCRSTAR